VADPTDSSIAVLCSFRHDATLQHYRLPNVKTGVTKVTMRAERNSRRFTDQGGKGCEVVCAESGTNILRERALPRGRGYPLCPWLVFGEDGSGVYDLAVALLWSRGILSSSSTSSNS
jgi:hypothetical protein